MVKLKSSDAAILARVARYRRLGSARRFKMLQNASTEGRAIGKILITGEVRGMPEDYLRAAKSIDEWATGKKSERFQATADASRTVALSAH